MDVTSVNATTASSQNLLQAQSELSGLNQDAFMSLLLAQLQNQDPMKPMEDTEFIAQLAQFNSLNELTQINGTLEKLSSTMALSDGSALMGKTVTGLSSEGLTVTGLVSGLRLFNNQVLLDLDGQTLPLDAVTEVR